MLSVLPSYGELVASPNTTMLDLLALVGVTPGQEQLDQVWRHFTLDKPGYLSTFRCFIL